MQKFLQYEVQSEKRKTNIAYRYNIFNIRTRKKQKKEEIITLNNKTKTYPTYIILRLENRKK
jgi:hypothetical protein